MQLELRPGEFQAEGTMYQGEGAEQCRLSGMEWGKEWMVRAQDWLGHLDIILGACQERCVDLRSIEYEECGIGKYVVSDRLGPRPYLLDWC